MMKMMRMMIFISHLLHHQEVDTVELIKVSKSMLRSYKSLTKRTFGKKQIDQQWELIRNIFLTTTSTVTMGQQEYPSGARDMVGEMIGNQLEKRRSAKPEERMKTY